MRIVKFNKIYINEMAKLFAESFSESDLQHTWTVKTAKNNLKTYYKYFGEYCFMAVEKKECLGSIFCLTNPYFQGTMLLVIAIIVKPEHRKKGVGKALMKKVFEKGKKKGLIGIKLMADSRKAFLRNWYKKIGFKESGWTEYEKLM